MSKFKTHFIGGTIWSISSLCLIFVAGVIFPVLAVDFDLYLVLAAIACTMAFSLFADIDTKSVPQFIFYSMVLMVDIVLIMAEKYQVAAVWGALALFPLFFKHRGVFHSLYFAILIPVLLFSGLYFLDLISRPMAIVLTISGIIGYIAHLRFDNI